MSKIEVQVKKRYGRLKVVSKPYRKKVGEFNKSFVWCTCKCNPHIALEFLVSSLKVGNTNSCGCLHLEVMQNLKTTHGLTDHKLYQIWLGMKARCYNENHKSYHRYGKRGIIICKEWLEDFKNFYEWAILRWKLGLTIERINNNGNYEPDNCTFITKKKQAYNTSRNVFITAFNETKTLTEWSQDKRCVVIISVLRQRLNRDKWLPEKAITYIPDTRKYDRK